uniref:Uncharacterized protein n=1 Tax=Rhizophora mucronata TaxID=61149 RepID=A0A2P2N284_RHIMU
MCQSGSDIIAFICLMHTEN